MVKYKIRRFFKKKLFHKITLWLHAFGPAIIIILLLIGVTFVGFEIRYKNKFYPGISIGNKSVGGQTYEEAYGYFKKEVEKLQKEGIQISFKSSDNAREVNIPMSVTGLTADNSVEYFTIGEWESELKEAYGLGRKANIVISLKERSELFFYKKSFNFPIIVQREAVNSLLEDELSGFLKESITAEFLLINGKISISEEKVGEVINKEEVVSALEYKLAQFDLTKAVFKSSVDIPKVTGADLKPFLGFAENIAKEINLVFEYRGYRWKVKGSKLATWLTIKEGKIEIDDVKLENYFTNTVAKFINNPPRNSRFEMHNGKLIEIVPGRSGNIVNGYKALQTLNYSLTDLTGNTIKIPIETIEIEPKVTKDTIEKYHIKDLDGEVRTNFTGSTLDREYNIKIGAATITGILIAPGAEFSTVSAIGPVTEKEGYKKELVIKKDKTIKEFGGGLCQIATTLFRLALNAGLPITERTNHRFVVNYYGAGLDATIYGPHPDFRFVNDTNDYLLLQARVEGKQVVMELYGQKDGRIAEISNPVLYNQIPAPETKYVLSNDLKIGVMECSETPHDGVTADALYTVKYPNGIVKTKNFNSVYQPWQKVCLIGIALK